MFIIFGSITLAIIITMILIRLTENKEPWI